MPNFYTYYWNTANPVRVDAGLDSSFFGRGRDDSQYARFSNPADINKDIQILQALGIPTSLQDGVANTNNQILVVTPTGDVTWQEVAAVSDLAVGNPAIAWDDLTDSPGLGQPNQILTTAGGTLAWTDLPDPSTITPPANTPPGTVPVVQPDGTTSYEEICFTDGLCDTPASLGTEGQVLTVENGAIAWTNPAPATEVAAPPNTPPGSVAQVQPDGSVKYEMPTFTALTDTPGVLGNPNQVLAVSATGDIVWSDPPAPTALQAPVGVPNSSVPVAMSDGTVQYKPLNFIDLGDTPTALGTEATVLSISGGKISWIAPPASAPTAPPGSPPGTVPVTQPDGTVAFEKPTFIGLSDTPAALGTEGQVLSIDSGVLNWVSPDTSIPRFTALPDTPSAIEPGKYLVGNQMGNALEWKTLAEVSSGIANSLPPNALSLNSIAAGADGQVLGTVGTGVQWIDPASVASAAPAAASVPPTSLQPGAESQVLTTVSGAVTWSNPSAIASQITTAITNNSLAANKLAPGTDKQVLTTVGTTVQWADAADAGAGAWLDLSDTPAAFGTTGKPVVVNAAGDGLEFGEFPAPPTGAATFIDLSDTPATITANRVVGTNATGTALTYLDPATFGVSDFIALNDTPAAFGTAGKPVVVNATGDGLEFGDFPPPPSGAANFTELGDTPNTITGDRLVGTNAAGTALTYVDPATVGTTEFIGLTDTPATITADQLVGTNAAGDAIVYIDPATVGTSEFVGLTDTPATITADQLVGTNAAGDAIVYIDPDTVGVSEFIELDDTPATFEANKNVVVNAAGDAVEFVDVVESIALCEFLTDESVENRSPGLVTFVVPDRLAGYKTDVVKVGVFGTAAGTFSIAVKKKTGGTDSDILAATAFPASTANSDYPASSTALAGGDILFLEVSAANGTAPTGLTVTLDIKK